MDKVELGRRITEARTAVDMTQQGLADAVGLDRSAIITLEQGKRNLKVPELVEIAQALDRPLTYFVRPTVPAAVSRRSSPETRHESTHQLDLELDEFAADLRSLQELGLIVPFARDTSRSLPDSHEGVELVAAGLRTDAGLGATPITDLGRTCERFGLYTYSVPLGAQGPDGGCVEIESTHGSTGAAVINGDAASGRRRMTLAHELGHWVFGDAYDTGATFQTERMINSFAIHFLAPRSGVVREWNAHKDWTIRDRAIVVSATYRLSWTAALSQLRNLGLIDHAERDRLVEHEPRSGDFLRLELTWPDELEPGYLSPGFTSACMRGYTESKLTADRTLQLLRGILTEQDLPDRSPLTLDDFRASFAGHNLGSPGHE
ncbi:XRE family transcriptional regulator [Brevibacterium litoralis]|uniref:XRE family transcriptional regulator n=1 Tax=Brevibacterium litoralis TaxID=3138935 RepID=UPI0032EE8A21